MVETQEPDESFDVTMLLPVTGLNAHGLPITKEVIASKTQKEQEKEDNENDSDISEENLPRFTHM